MDREELWQRLEQQAADNYANLKAQGVVTAPLPAPLTSTEAVSMPLGNFTGHIYDRKRATSINES